MPPETEQSNIPEGCEFCPNRKRESDRQRGNWTALLFALFLTGVVGIYSVERRSDGWHSKEEPPYLVWGTLIPTIGLLLGVRIDAEMIGRMIGGRG